MLEFYERILDKDKLDSAIYKYLLDLKNSNKNNLNKS
jgi:hypothetical protein